MVKYIAPRLYVLSQHKSTSFHRLVNWPEPALQPVTLQTILNFLTFSVGVITLT